MFAGLSGQMTASVPNALGSNLDERAAAWRGPRPTPTVVRVVHWARRSTRTLWPPTRNPEASEKMEVHSRRARAELARLVAHT